jgi:predicted DNA-binding transcriptional regulator YafY
MAAMLPAAARVLRLLALLQLRREWPGRELADRLGVTGRTVRRDVERLRQLGYVVEASSGHGGGYRLGAGTITPPLLLDDDEAVAVAMALGAAASRVAEEDDVALRVLAKLDQLMPRRLRRRLDVLPAVTLTLADPRTAVSLRVLATLATACRDHVEVRFRYQDGAGVATARRVEPLRLVHTGARWYLVGWDLGRHDWRTFRIDRVDRATPVAIGESFTPRTLPEDAATFVSRSIRMAPSRLQARFLVPGTLAEVRTRMPSWMGMLEPHDDRHVRLSIGGDTYDEIIGQIVLVGVPFTLLDPPELEPAMRAVVARLAAAGGMETAGQAR